MRYIKILFVAALAGALGSGFTHRLEVQKAKGLVEEAEWRTREKIWSEAFYRGWDRAQENYTRYYDEKTWKLVFGTDRPW